jgi:hypothetical protein
MIRIPPHWQAEIDAGTEFGLKAQVAMKAAALKAEVGPQRTAGPQRKSCGSKRSCTDCSNAGTLMMAAIEVDTGQPVSCGSCKTYLLSLNRMSSHDHAAIVQKLYAEISWPQSWRATHGDKHGQRNRIGEIVSGVLASATTTCKVVRPVRPQVARGGRQNSRRPYTGWRSEADGPRIEHGPFVSSIRHLTYHVYAAKKHDSWKWNLEQLAKRWRLFNGTRIIGISEGPEAQSASQVIAFAESLGMVFDHHVIRPNNEKLREVVTWVPMLSLLKPESAGENEVVFSAHAKGQKYDDPAHTRDWTDLMYQSCLDDWPAVYNALRTSLMAGSMREYGLLGKWHNWAYSGTFYWWRLAEIGNRKWRDVDQWFAGTESWPGKMCDPREAACLFLNDSRRMYEHQYWVDVVWPEWNRYLQQRK